MRTYDVPPQGRLTWPALFFACVCTLPGLSQTAAPVRTATLPKIDQADQRIRFAQAQLARDPEFWTNYNRLAAAYAQKARESGEISYFELAESALKQSLKLESTHDEAVPAFTQMASVHLAEHRFREAGEDAEHAIRLLPGDLGAYPYAGDAQLEQGNYSEAQRFYDHLADPADGKPHPGIAFLASSHGAGLRWIAGKTAEADEDLEHAIALGKELHLPAENVAWTEFMLGEQFFLTGDLDGAEREEDAALVAFPRYHRALAAMGQIRAAQTRFAEAIAFYRQAIAIVPFPLYIAALGDVYTALGDKAAAEKQYALVEYIGKLSAINQQVFNRELATFYADHDRKLPEALALARKELEVRHDVYTSDALAWAMLKNHLAAEASMAMEQALRMGTCDAMMEYHAAMIAAAMGDQAKEKVHLARALAINPRFHVLFAQRAVDALAALDGGRQAGEAATTRDGDAVAR